MKKLSLNKLNIDEGNVLSNEEKKGVSGGTNDCGCYDGCVGQGAFWGCVEKCLEACAAQEAY